MDYGFANVLGVPSGSVHADALVNVFTAGQRVMPMYAVKGCDYGLQTLVGPGERSCHVADWSCSPSTPTRTTPS